MYHSFSCWIVLKTSTSLLNCVSMSLPSIGGIICPFCKKPQPYFIRFKKGSRKVQCPGCKVVFDASKYGIPKNFILQAWKLPPEQREKLFTNPYAFSHQVVAMLNGGSSEKVNVDVGDEDEVIELKSSSSEDVQKQQQQEQQGVSLSGESVGEYGRLSDKVVVNIDETQQGTHEQGNVGESRESVKIEEVTESKTGNAVVINQGSGSPTPSTLNMSEVSSGGGAAPQITSNTHNAYTHVNQHVSPSPSLLPQQQVNNVGGNNVVYPGFQTPYQLPYSAPPSPQRIPSGGVPFPPGVGPGPGAVPPPPSLPQVQQPPEPLRRRTSAEILEQILSAYGVDEELKRWLVNIAYQYDEQGLMLDPNTLEALLYMWTSGGRRKLNLAAIMTIVNHYAREYYKEIFKDETYATIASTFAHSFALHNNPVIAGLLGAFREIVMSIKQEVENLKRTIGSGGGGGQSLPPEFYQLYTELKELKMLVEQLRSGSGSSGNQGGGGQGGLNVNALDPNKVSELINAVSSVYSAAINALKSAVESLRSVAAPPYSYKDDAVAFVDRLFDRTFNFIEKRNILDRVANAFGKIVAYAKLAESGKITPEMVANMAEVTEVGLSEGRVASTLIRRREGGSESLRSTKVFYERPPSEYIPGKKASSSSVAEIVEKLGGEVEKGGEATEEHVS